MKKVNIKTLKSRLTIEDHKKIMKALDIPVFSENNDTIIYYTGDKNRDAYKGSPKLYFYKDNRIYQGYTSARSYDIISLVQTRLQLLSKPYSFQDAINFIVSIAGLEFETIKRIDSPHICDWSSLEKFARLRSTGQSLTPYDKRILDQLNNSIPQQWIDEGISIDTMEKYKIGYYPRTQSTTIPCFNSDGELIGVRVRNWNPEDIESGRKYMPLMLLNGTCYKFPTNEVFFGINYNKPEIERTGTVILVEGEKGVMRGDTMWGEKNNTLALYGSQLGVRRRNQLIKMGVSHVILALDSDFHEYGDKDYEVFEKKIFSLGKLFKGYAEVEVVYNNIGLKNAYQCSPFDFDKETFDKLWEARETL